MELTDELINVSTSVEQYSDVKFNVELILAYLPLRKQGRGIEFPMQRTLFYDELF